MGTADFRETRFELKSIKQDANGLHVEATERGVFGSAPPSRFVSDVVLSKKELATVTEALTILETKYGEIHAEAEGQTTPERVHALMNQEEAVKARIEAAKTEAARIEAENIVKRDEADELAANLETMRKAAEERA